jgi:hypothetical protein
MKTLRVPMQRSLFHMDMVEPVRPVFSMQGPSGSVNNISRLRNNNTNLINGFYKVNNNLRIHHDFVFAGARRNHWTVQISSSNVR